MEKIDILKTATLIRNELRDKFSDSFELNEAALVDMAFDEDGKSYLLQMCETLNIKPIYCK